MSDTSSAAGSPCSIPSDMEEERFGNAFYDSDDEMDSQHPYQYNDTFAEAVTSLSLPLNEAKSPRIKESPYSRKIISILTKTSDPNRTYPQSTASGCDPEGLLYAVERHWRTMARCLAIQDIQANRFGKQLEHVWNVNGSGLVVILVFDLTVGPITLQQMNHGRLWDPCNISKKLAFFLDSLIDHAEWICPTHLTSSKQRESQEQTTRHPYVVHESYESRTPFRASPSPPRASYYARRPRASTVPALLSARAIASFKHEDESDFSSPDVNDDLLGPRFPFMPLTTTPKHLPSSQPSSRPSTMASDNDTLSPTGSKWSFLSDDTSGISVASEADSESAPPSLEPSPAACLKPLPTALDRKLASCSASTASIAQDPNVDHLPHVRANRTQIHKRLPSLHPRSPRPPKSPVPAIVQNIKAIPRTARSPALPVVSPACASRMHSPIFSNAHAGSEGLHRLDPAIEGLQHVMEHEQELEHKRALEARRLRQINQFRKTVHPGDPHRVDPPLVQKPVALLASRRIGEGDDYDFEAIDDLASSPSLSMILEANGSPYPMPSANFGGPRNRLEDDALLMSYEQDLGLYRSIAESPEYD